ncbi:MAG: ribosome small subunit-dependent GTPase A [Candidatus Azobacteroides sp.]|nr:ribosome small subunit-dependent GTPase A [Candidatus Azobacteroides sp.]
MRGLVVKNTGSWYQVYTGNGDSIDCKIKGNFRLQGIRSTNPVAVGDRVIIETNKEGTALITGIEERKNYIIRRSSNLSKQFHIIAANVDRAVLIVTVDYPQTSTIFIDRFLCSAEAYHVPVTLVINKIDLYNGEEIEYMDELVSLYEHIGYPCLKISALDPAGLDELRLLLKEKITLFSGNSGVGKSTLINALIPGTGLKIGEISKYHNKGVHTTTFSEMIALPGGGYLIDTPGIKGFGSVDMEGAEVGHYFREIFKASANCRFADCTHRHEPGCAVLKDVENHLISQSRYTGYLSILHDSENGKYR